MLSESRRYLGRNALFPRMNLADYLNQFFARHAFKNVGRRSRLKSALDFNIPFESRQHNETRFGEFGADGDHGVYSTFVGKPEVHERHVGKEFAELLDGFLCAGSLSNHRHVRLTVTMATRPSRRRG